MTEATMSLTTAEDFLSLGRQLFDQYRTTIFILTGACMFF